MDKNIFGKVPSIIATNLGLKEASKCTGHSIRRGSTTMLADAGASMALLKRCGVWKNTNVAEEYLEDSISSKNKISKMLASRPSIN
mgnify:FL=1